MEERRCLHTLNTRRSWRFPKGLTRSLLLYTIPTYILLSLLLRIRLLHTSTLKARGLDSIFALKKKSGLSPPKRALLLQRKNEWSSSFGHEISLSNLHCSSIVLYVVVHKGGILLEVSHIIVATVSPILEILSFIMKTLSLNVEILSPIGDISIRDSI